MMLCYALEERGSGFTLAFSASCAASAGYALMIGSWPFFAVEVVWTGVAAHRGWRRHAASKTPGLRTSNTHCHTCTQNN